jgi:hypothetical protein
MGTFCIANENCFGTLTANAPLTSGCSSIKRHLQVVRSLLIGFVQSVRNL